MKFTALRRKTEPREITLSAYAITPRKDKCLKKGLFLSADRPLKKYSRWCNFTNHVAISLNRQHFIVAYHYEWNIHRTVCWLTNVSPSALSLVLLYCAICAPGCFFKIIYLIHFRFKVQGSTIVEPKQRAALFLMVVITRDQCDKGNFDYQNRGKFTILILHIGAVVSAVASSRFGSREGSFCLVFASSPCVCVGAPVSSTTKNNIG